MRSVEETPAEDQANEPSGPELGGTIGLPHPADTTT
jgi:hypothetical protein